MDNEKINVGLVGVGLHTYWGQFEGLYERLRRYQCKIVARLHRPDIRIINAGMLDCPEKAKEKAEVLSREKIGLLFVYISTYALSSTLLPLVRRLKVPVVLLNIQPAAHIDYAYLNGLEDRDKRTGEWLANCQACSVPELASVFNRSGIPYEIVTGHLEDDATWAELEEWLAAAVVRGGMENSRMGILGHYYSGMMDVYSDLLQQSSAFGTHIELLEMCELKAYRDAVSPKEIEDKMEEFRHHFEVAPECQKAELTRAARTSVALDRLTAGRRLDAMAYYYEGCAGNEYEEIVTSVIAGNTLLTGRNIPVAGECEVKNVQAMKILSLLDAGGSFSEFYGMDFRENVLLLGHDGPAHFSIAEGKVKLVPLPVYHGKPGKGLSLQMTVKYGPVTLLAVCEGKDGVFLLAAEGESVPGPVLQIGNTNSRYRFACGIRQFIEKWSKAGPSHHCAVGIGHVMSKLEKVAFLSGIPLIKVVG